MTDYMDYTYYELCSLYCDYHEWLMDGPAVSGVVEEKYKWYMREILHAIATKAHRGGEV